MSQVTYHPISTTDRYHLEEKGDCRYCKKRLSDSFNGSLEELVGHYAQPRAYYPDLSQKSIHIVHRSCLAKHALDNIQILKNHAYFPDLDRDHPNLNYSVKCNSCDKKIANLYDFLPLENWQDRAYAAILPIRESISNVHNPSSFAADITIGIFFRTWQAAAFAGSLAGAMAFSSPLRASIIGAIGGAFVGAVASMQISLIMGCITSQSRTFFHSLQSRVTFLEGLRDMIPVTLSAILLNLVPLYAMVGASRAMQRFSDTDNEAAWIPIWCAAVVAIIAIAAFRIISSEF